MEQHNVYRPLCLGGLLIRGRLVLAPMAGITDDVMRLLCKRYGAALTYTEMVSAKGLLMSERSRSLLKTREGEGPVAAQLFGQDAAVLAQAARYIERSYAGSIAMIDINMGCPAQKIIKSGEGSALLLDLPRAADIMERVVRAVRLPVSIKIRIGYYTDENVSVELARLAAKAGVCAITVHGRTREQGYAGQADWGAVAAVKAAAGPNVAVIGNGDVADIKQAQMRMIKSGCDAVMIGRAAIGQPWVFAQHTPALAERKEVVREHLMLEIEKHGEKLAMTSMRKILAAYVHGMPGAARTRARIFQSADFRSVWAAMEEFFAGMEGEEAK